MKNKISVSDLIEVPETLLIPLWARAYETELDNPIIKDDIAVRICRKINYDFKKFEKVKFSQIGCSVRSAILDRETARFISKNPEGVIINLGCGLDSRFTRLDNGSITWYDLDIPETINIRKKFYEETMRSIFISKSILDFSWIKEIRSSEKAVLIIAEGLLMYFSEEDIIEIFNQLTAAFPSADMLLELLAPALVGRAKRHDAVSKMNETIEFKWTLKNAGNFNEVNKKIEFISQWRLFDFNKKRWGLVGYIMRLPMIKNKMSQRIVHIKFKN